MPFPVRGGILGGSGWPSRGDPPVHKLDRRRRPRSLRICKGGVRKWTDVKTCVLTSGLARVVPLSRCSTCVDLHRLHLQRCRSSIYDTGICYRSEGSSKAAQRYFAKIWRFLANRKTLDVSIHPESRACKTSAALQYRPSTMYRQRPPSCGRSKRASLPLSPALAFGQGPSPFRCCRPFLLGSRPQFFRRGRPRRSRRGDEAGQVLQLQ